MPWRESQEGPSPRLPDGALHEVPLIGGRLTAGVVRVGDTVRRPAGPRSAFTAQLLAQLAEAGFLGAPIYLGRDSRGRDMLSWIPGTVPAKWQGFTDEQVYRAGLLIRGFHGGTRGSDLCAGRTVVCHHDAGPNNVVFRAGQPVALIDFDLAAPGDPIEDVGYMAWAWCISSKPSRGPVERQAAQVRLLASACGLSVSELRELPDAIQDRQERNLGFWTTTRAQGVVTATPRDQVDEILAWTRRELAFTRAHLSVFASALRGDHSPT